MNKLIRTKVYALWVLLLASVSAFGQNNVIDEVVWVVGDEAILKSDVESERNMRRSLIMTRRRRS